ncbi:GerA spore germination protein [Paenibacillus taihuensis]|uniref:GerA spore germination protein n=1 Tax=Paenibacillus taihuensis TaxID=1156355 RepID=A0A3D9RII1_9BACL|nr:spore germination protein [Paenibacillus taihuensis]REE78922.1 GerA spore germination protein [Paenibacillus taihuensis]
MSNSQTESSLPTLAHTLDQFEDCMDLSHREFPNLGVHAVYLNTLISGAKLQNEVFKPLHDLEPDQLTTLFQQSQFEKQTDDKALILGILSGKAAVFAEEQVYLIDVRGAEGRAITNSEIETTITGPHDALTEQVSLSLMLIRARIRSTHLKIVKLSVGEITKNDVYILYIKDIANMDNVQELKQRISDIEIDAVHDTNMLIQLIDDRPYALFPQILTTERPDAVVSKLVAGRVVGIMDGSPSAFSVPSTFYEFFSSSDDYYQRWMLGTATRMLRFFALIVTVSLTALYVSVTTFHYEMIPENLLMTLVESRSRVPFPPLYEALLMEMTIELLREAGARLPTKIGQTIGIVGGIVIGQAAVQAGFTSNILIIAVALSTIASFVIPNYTMSASIRLMRFGFILLAGLWGNLGIAIGITATTIHLCSLISMKASYVTPIAPNQPYEWRDVFIRAPFNLLKKRPTQSRPMNMTRVKPKR